MVVEIRILHQIAHLIHATTFMRGGEYFYTVEESDIQYLPKQANSITEPMMSKSQTHARVFHHGKKHKSVKETEGVIKFYWYCFLYILPDIQLVSQSGPPTANVSFPKQ